MPTRRALLRTVAGGAAALSGCSSPLAAGNSGFELCPGLLLYSLDDEPHHVDLLVEADGEPLYWGGYDLPARPEPSTAADRRLDAPASFDDRVNRLAMQGRVDGGATVGPFEITAADVSGDLLLRYAVDESGTLAIERTYGGANCQPATVTSRN